MAAKQESGLRLETVLEDLMQEMVVRPLSKHLRCLFLQQNPQHSLKSAMQGDKDLCQYLMDIKTQIGEVYSAQDKLRLLTDLVTTVTQCSDDRTTPSSFPECNVRGVRDSVERLSSLLSSTHWLTAGLEADTVWGLLSPSLLDPRAAHVICLVSCAALSVTSEAEAPVLRLTDMRTECHNTLEIPVRPDMSVADILTTLISADTNTALVSCHITNDIDLERDLLARTVLEMQQHDNLNLAIKMKSK